MLAIKSTSVKFFGIISVFRFIDQPVSDRNPNINKVFAKFLEEK